MNNKGVTLVELIVAVIISGVVLLALTCQFITQQNIVKALFDQSTAINEASIAMHHMTRTLRFASGNITVVPNYSVTATIEKDHLSNITAATLVTYRLTGNNIEYIEGASAPIVIAGNITVFSPSYPSLAINRLTIQLTAQTKNSNNIVTKTFTIESIIVPLPNA